MNNNIIIRPARVGDATGIFTAHKRSIQELGPGHYSAEQVAAWFPDDRTADTYRERIINQSKNYIVAEINGAVAGFTSYRSNEIDTMYVNPDFLRQGIASALYHHAEQLIKNNGYQNIWVIAALPAIPFYQKMGFCVIDEEGYKTQIGLVLKMLKMEKPLV